MNPYPAVLVEGPWIRPPDPLSHYYANQFSRAQDETVRLLTVEVERRAMELRAAELDRLKRKPWALPQDDAAKDEQGSW